MGRRLYDREQQKHEKSERLNLYCQNQAAARWKRRKGAKGPAGAHEEHTRSTRGAPEEHTRAPPMQLACPWLWGSFGVALEWLWGGFGVPIGWLSTGFGVALRWLCTPESMPSIWLVYGFGWLRDPIRCAAKFPAIPADAFGPRPSTVGPTPGRPPRRIVPPCNSI
jgi:hypothetical protein